MAGAAEGGADMEEAVTKQGLQTTLKGGFDATFDSTAFDSTAASCTFGSRDLSDQNGHGEDSMMVFIQKHLGSILKPFADHVDELHKSVGHVGMELAHAVKKMQENAATVEKHAGLLGGVRSELTKLHSDSSTAQAAQESLRAEKAALEEDHQRARQELQAVDERLTSTESTVADQQQGIKSTRAAISKVREGLTKTDRDIAVRLGPALDQLSLDLKRLDIGHQGTAQLLQETKTFTSAFHQQFETFEKQQEQQQNGNNRRFDNVNDQLNEVRRLLTDANSAAQLQAEELNGINATLQPVRHRVDQLEAARDEARRKHDDLERAVTDLRVRCNSMGVDVDKLNEFYEEAKRGEDIFEVVGSLKRETAKITEHVSSLLETTRTLDADVVKGNHRITELEKGLEGAQEHTAKLNDRVGMGERMGHTPSPRLQPPQPQFFPAPTHDAADEAGGLTPGGGLLSPKNLSPGGPGSRVPLSVLRALDKMSITARQKRAIDQINDHTKQLASATTKLQNTATQLEDTTGRILSLEQQMQSTSEEVRRLSQGLDLNHEYWKGLSRGIKETNRSVNVEGEVLPPKGTVGTHMMKLPQIGSRPPSQQKSHCIMSAR